MDEGNIHGHVPQHREGKYRMGGSLTGLPSPGKVRSVPALQFCERGTLFFCWFPLPALPFGTAKICPG
jgi:hypothetical protein